MVGGNRNSLSNAYRDERPRETAPSPQHEDVRDSIEQPDEPFDVSPYIDEVGQEFVPERLEPPPRRSTRSPTDGPVVDRSLSLERFPFGRHWQYPEPGDDEQWTAPYGELAGNGLAAAAQYQEQAWLQEDEEDEREDQGESEADEVTASDGEHDEAGAEGQAGAQAEADAADDNEEDEEPPRDRNKKARAVKAWKDKKDRAFRAWTVKTPNHNMTRPARAATHRNYVF